MILMKSTIYLLCMLCFSFPLLAEDSGKIYSGAASVDPVYQDYIQTLGSAFSTNKNDFRDSVISPRQKMDFKVIYSNIRKDEEDRERKKRLDKYRKKSPYKINPLFYKVKFPWEGGPISSAVLPFNLRFADSSEKNFVFTKLVLKPENYAALKQKLEDVSFKIAGEREICNSAGEAAIKEIWGWIAVSKFSSLLEEHSVTAISLLSDKNFSSKVNVDFTVKMPYYVGERLFLSSFVRNITERNGFSLKEVKILNGNLAQIVGEIPFNQIEEVYALPFVLQLKTVQ